LVANNKQLASNFASADDATRTTTSLPEGWPARQASKEEATSVAPPRKKRERNVIESDDDVDGEDVDDDAPPAEMCEYSMGNNGFDSSPGLRLTGHAASRAGSDKKL
jgi:hypothetical protein